MIKKYYTIAQSGSNFLDVFAQMYPELNYISAEYNDMSSKTITFVMEEGCNLKCTYCYQIHKNHKKRMSKEIAKQAVEALFDKDKMKKYLNEDIHKCVILDFIGGEPMLNVEVMDYIVDYFKYYASMKGSIWAQNYMINVTTNGTLNHTEKVKKFIKKNTGRISVGITIDGDKALHDACRVFPDGSGSYDIVYKNMMEAIAMFGLRSTKVTLAPENIDKINSSIPHLFNMGLTDIHANVVFEDVWKDEHVTVFYNELIKLADYILDNKIYEHAYCSLFDDYIGKPMDPADDRNWCGGDGKMLAIGTDGNLYPCIRFMKYSLSDTTPEITVGTLNDGVKSPEDDPQLKELFSITRSSQSPDKCLNCKVASGCAWCTGYNYDVFGTPNKRATFICDMHKARVAANVYYYNKLYKLVGEEQVFENNLSEDEMEFIKGE